MSGLILHLITATGEDPFTIDSRLRGNGSIGAELVAGRLKFVPVCVPACGFSFKSQYDGVKYHADALTDLI
jgi:hypothetical protein